MEKCVEGSDFWEKAPGVVNGTAHVVRDLEPGKKYKFRVKAENMYGVGDPAETDRAVLAKNPYGMFLSKLIFTHKIEQLCSSTLNNSWRFSNGAYWKDRTSSDETMK